MMYIVCQKFSKAKELEIPVQLKLQLENRRVGYLTLRFWKICHYLLAMAKSRSMTVNGRQIYGRQGVRELRNQDIEWIVRVVIEIKN